MRLVVTEALAGVASIDWTPWLAITQRQLKVLTLFVIGLILLAVGFFVALRVIRRLRRVEEGLGEPVDVEPVREVERPRGPRAVDAAIANLLEQAAPIDGDERSDDDLFTSVVRITVELGGVSIPALQRRLHLDFARASAFVERMADEEMLSEPGPGGKRKVTDNAQEFLDGPVGTGGE